MAVRTKPVRIFEKDHAPLRLLADLKDLSPAEVFHLAMAEYLHHHRKELSGIFAEAQTVLAAGDVEGLTRLLQPGAEQEVEQLMKDLAQHTEPAESP